MRSPPSSSPTARSSGSEPIAVEGHVHHREERRSSRRARRRRRTRIAARRRALLEARPPRRPPPAATIGVQRARPALIGAICDAGRAIGEQPGADEHAASQRAERGGREPRSSWAPPCRDRHHEQRPARRRTPAGIDAAASGAPDRGAERRGGHDPGDAEGGARRPTSADGEPIVIGNERPRRRRNYLAGPGAARAGATSGRSG